MSRESRFAALVIAGLAFVSTAPALAVTGTDSWVAPLWNYGPNVARVDIPQRSVVAFSSPGLPKSLSVSGIRVYDLSQSSARMGTIAVADVQVWWRNGGGPWSRYGGYRRVASHMPNNLMINNSVVLPDLTVPVLYSGFNYRVTVVISWWMYGVRQGYSKLDFNSASDYWAMGNAQVFPGCVLIR
jgi:hypothetical protein